MEKIYGDKVKKKNKSTISKLIGNYEKKGKSIVKDLKKKVKSKEVLKKSNLSVSIPDYKAPSVLGDENRFFKGEMDKEKRSMFFG